MNPNKKIFAYLIIVTIFLGGCATTQKSDMNADPYEDFNRHMYNFNRAMDHTFLRPLGRGYNFITPNVVQHRVTNFFSNIDDTSNMANDLFQLNIRQFNWDMWRVAINSTAGIGGLFDVADSMGLGKHHNDFGLTMVRWGWTDSNYLIVPFIGPRTVRDAIGTGPDILMTPWPYIQPWELGWGIYGLDYINNRAALLPYDKLLDDAFNPYVALRNAYMQHRSAQVSEITNPEKASNATYKKNSPVQSIGMTTVANTAPREQTQTAAKANSANTKLSTINNTTSAAANSTHSTAQLPVPNQALFE